MPDTASENVSIPRTKAELPWEETISTVLCAMLGLVGVVLHWADFTSAGSLSRAAFAGACVAGAIGPVQNAWSLLRRGILSVDLLMIVAAVGAAIIGDWVESVALLFLFSLSGTLEAFATYRTTRSIESLIQLRPRDALRIDGTSADGERVAIEALRVNDIVRVRPGERFPVDGVVSEGETWADESTLTGESEAIHKPLDSNVYAGTINGPGTVLVRMTRAVADTTIARIVHMVQEAQAQKTPTQRFVESWQQPYVIGVMLMASLALLGARYLHTSNWHDAFYHAMVILVAASPCAVVVSSPSVMLSAIARAGRQGVLFKGGVHVEGLGKVDVMAFDKTGTVTIGKPSVTQVWVDSTTDARQLVELAAAVERHSEHPLGVPVIAEAAARGIEAKPTTLDDFHSHTGLGIHARIAGTWIGIGREGLFATHELNTPTELLQQAQQMREQGHTALLVITKEPSMRGVIGVADQIRPEAVATIAALKRLGIRKIVMLTGDHERVARVIASKVDVDDVRAGLLPDQKVTAIKSLSNDGSMVAMVGDGVNDAPALAAAQVGIAMGGAGTDVALEVADVVLMRDDLRTLPFAVWISRLAIRRVRQNIIFAFGVICVLVIASFFNLPLWLSVLGHEGSTVLVVFNGLRLLWQKQPDFDMPRIATEESSRSNEKGKD